MSGTKIATLASYLVLALLAALADGQLSSYALYILGGLALAHLIEIALFYKRCQQAGGSLPVHLLNVFLFGIFHIKELESATQ